METLESSAPDSPGFDDAPGVLTWRLVVQAPMTPQVKGSVESVHLDPQVKGGPGVFTY